MLNNRYAEITGKQHLHVFSRGTHFSNIICSHAFQFWRTSYYCICTPEQNPTVVYTVVHVCFPLHRQQMLRYTHDLIYATVRSTYCSGVSKIQWLLLLGLKSILLGASRPVGQVTQGHSGSVALLLGSRFLPLFAALGYKSYLGWATDMLGVRWRKMSPRSIYKNQWHACLADTNNS